MVVSIYNPNLFSTSARGENPLFLASSISASNLARPAFRSARSAGVRDLLVFGVAAFFRSTTVFVGIQDDVCIWKDIVLGGGEVVRPGPRPLLLPHALSECRTTQNFFDDPPTRHPKPEHPGNGALSPLGDVRVFEGVFRLC